MMYYPIINVAGLDKFDSDKAIPIALKEFVKEFVKEFAKLTKTDKNKIEITY